MTLTISWLTLILMINNVILFLLAIFFFIRRDTKGALQFSFIMFACVIWTLGVRMESAVLGVEQKVFWSKISYLGIVSVAPLWLAFAAEFAQFSHKAREWIKSGAWFIPIFSLIMVFTNEYHGLVWPYTTPVSNLPGAAVIYGHGLVFYIHMIYAYALILAGTFILVRYLVTTITLQRIQAFLAVVSVLVPLFANMLYAVFGETLGGVEVTPFAFTITGILLAIAIYRYSFLDAVPAAKEAIFQNLESGIIILNAEGEIVDVNPATKKLLGLQIKKGISFAIRNDLFAPEFYDVALGKKSKMELFLPRNKTWLSIHAYKLTMSNQGVEGRMIFLFDITEEKQIRQELEDSHNLFSMVVDFLPDPTFVIDDAGKVVIWNKAIEKMSRVPAKEIVGKGDYAYAVPFYGEKRPMLANFVLNPKLEVEKHYMKVERNGDILTSEIVAKDIVLWAISKPLYNSEGKVIGAIESFRDITTQRNTEKNLQERLDTLTKLNDIMLRREERLSNLQEENERLKTTEVLLDAKKKISKKSKMGV